MKYIVMECHEAYAILMDEESRFFHAANLHYNVGQTVTSPILMQQPEAEEESLEKQTVPRIRRIVMRASAVAACLLLAGGAGYFRYQQNNKPESVVVLNSDANIRMYLNKEGKVVELKSDNEAGDALLESYDGRKKSKVTVAHELLALQIANGNINDGDTVEVYISAQSPDAYDAYKTEFESDISKLNLHVNVQDLTAHPEVTAVTEPKVQPEKPPKPAQPDQTAKPDQAAKPEKPVKPGKPGTEPVQNPPVVHEDAQKPGEKEKPNAEIQPPKPEDPVKPPAEPPVAPADTPQPAEPAEHTAPQPADPKSENKTKAEPKPEKADPEPEKPVHPEKEHPAVGIGAHEKDEPALKKPEKPAPPHLQAQPAEPAPLPKPEKV